MSATLIAAGIAVGAWLVLPVMGALFFRHAWGGVGGRHRNWS